MPGRNAWCQRNIAERLTFSSFTTLRDDLWAAEMPRDFAIVALSGYATPKDLDKSSADSMWLESAPKDRLMVWDGFCPHALFEVIYECFGFTHRTMGGKIGVFTLVDGQIGAELTDDRAREVLDLRPTKSAGLSKVGRENHIADLFAWSCLFDAKNGGSKPFIKNGGRATKSLYSDFFTYTPRDLTISPMGARQSEDSRKRETLWSKTADLKPMRASGFLMRGKGEVAPASKTEIARYVGDDVREEISRKAEKSLSMVEHGSGPTSLYEALLPRSRDRRTGLVIGSVEAARENYEKTIGRPGQERPKSASDAMCDDEVDAAAPAALETKSWLGRIMASARQKSQRF